MRQEISKAYTSYRTHPSAEVVYEPHSQTLVHSYGQKGAERQSRGKVLFEHYPISQAMFLEFFPPSTGLVPLTHSRMNWDFLGSDCKKSANVTISVST